MYIGTRPSLGVLSTGATEPEGTELCCITQGLASRGTGISGAEHGRGDWDTLHFQPGTFLFGGIALIRANRGLSCAP